MTLYDIDRALMACVDEETGEVDEERFEALTMEREKKLENLACWIKDLAADASVLGTEIQNLQRRKKAVETKITALRRYLAWQLNGENLKTARAVAYYRGARQHAVVDDLDAIPDEYKRVTVEPMKDDLRDALLDGATIDGAHLEWGEASVTIR